MNHRLSRRLPIACAVAALAAGALGVPGRAATAAQPAAAVTDRDRGATGDRGRLDRVLAAQYAISPDAPGIAARVQRPGLHWTGAVGTSDRATGAPLQVEDTFRAASVTKTFTAAAVLALVDRRRVSLDAPIARYLTDAYRRLLSKGGYRPDLITVRQLLQHTGGLYDYATDDGYAQAAITHLDRHWTPAEQVGWAMRHGSAYGAPGQLYHYSDTGYVLLARIVESVTGLPQAAAYRALLRYGALGLTSTWFETLEAAPPTAGARAHQYFTDAASGLNMDTYAADPSFDLYGGGGLVSSIADLSRFYRALFDGRVISRPALRTMLTVVPTGHEGEGAGMGIFPRVIDGTTCWWHNGFWGSAVLYCPQRRLSVAVTVNVFTTARSGPGAMTVAMALAASAR